MEGCVLQNDFLLGSLYSRKKGDRPKSMAVFLAGCEDGSAGVVAGEGIWAQRGREAGRLQM